MVEKGFAGQMSVRTLPVSVVIASYNSKKWLREAIESINEGEQPPVEILLVDDASTDGTLQYSQALEAEFSNLRLISLPKNVGAAKARLQGIEMAQSEWICFVDADDRLQNKALSKASDLLTDQVDVVLFELWRFESEHQFWRDSANPVLNVMSGQQAFIASMGSWNIHAFGVYRKSAFLAAYRQLDVRSFNEDEILTRIIFWRARKVVTCAGKYWYRLNSESITRGFNAKFPGVMRSHVWLLENVSDLPGKRMRRVFKQAIKDCYRLVKDKNQYDPQWVEAELFHFFKQPTMGIFKVFYGVGFNPKYIWYYLRAKFSVKAVFK